MAKPNLDTLCELNETIQPGETVYLVLRHRARSGMYRVIDVFIMRDNEPRRISFKVAEALGYKYDHNHDGIGMSGAGMDMGFAIVYELSSSLYRSEDGSYSHDGAYCLDHHWI